MNKQQYDYINKLDYILDEQGKKHRIYPMKLKDRDKVTELFSHINDEYPVLNLPVNAVDKNGKPILDDEGKPVTDDTAYNAMLELLSLALHEDSDSIMEWIDLGQVTEVFAIYRGISELKKKLDSQTKKIIGMKSMLDLFPTLH